MAARKPKVTPEVAQAFSKEVVKTFDDFIDAGRATRWQKGQSGNIRGVTGPKGEQPDGLTDTIAWVLGKSGNKRLADSLIALATGEKPNLQAIMYIMDRIEGKPKQSVTETHIEGDPLLLLIQSLTDDAKQIEAPTSRPALPVASDFTITPAEVRENPSKNTKPPIQG